MTKLSQPAWLRVQGWAARVAGQALLIYDGDCGLCRATALRLQQRWPLAPIRYLPCQDDVVRRLVPAVPEARCLEAVTFVDEYGRIYQGADVVPIFWQLRDDLERPLARFWSWPGVMPALRVGYRWVARNRQWLSRLLGTVDTPRRP